jgi:hypothetical protein
MHWLVEGDMLFEQPNALAEPGGGRHAPATSTEREEEDFRSVGFGEWLSVYCPVCDLPITQGAMDGIVPEIL